MLLEFPWNANLQLTEEEILLKVNSFNFLVLSFINGFSTNPSRCTKSRYLRILSLICLPHRYVFKIISVIDATIRNQAEAHLNQAAESQYGQFVLALCVEFAADGKADNNRQLAGLYLKNLITAQDESILQQKQNKWLTCDPAIKDQIRLGVSRICDSHVNILKRYYSLFNSIYFYFYRYTVCIVFTKFIEYQSSSSSYGCTNISSFWCYRCT